MKNTPLFNYIIPINLCFYIYFSYLNKYMGYINLAVYGPLYIITILIDCQNIKLKKINSSYLPFIFVSWLFFTSNYAEFPATTIKLTIVNLFTLFPYMLYLQKKQNVALLMRLLLVCSLLFSLISIISIISPTIYFFVLNYLPADIRTEALKFYRNGITSGITNQTAINAWFSVIGLGLIFSKMMYKKKTSYLIPFFIFILAIMLTGKRAHLIFSLIPILIIYLFISKKVSLKTIGYLTLIILISIIGYSLFSEKIVTYFDRFVPKDNKDISTHRFGLWAIAYNYIIRNLIFGYGFGFYSNVMPMNVHNVYIQILCEAGIIGLSLFILMLFSNLKSVIIKVKKINLYQNEEKTYLIYSLFIQSFFMLYCLTGNPLNDVFIYVLYIVFSAIPRSIKEHNYNK